MDDFLQQLGSFTRSLPPLPGRTIMTRVAGSRSYNLHGPQSDWDWYGVFVAPTSALLSLDHQDKDDKVRGDVPNYQFHELLPFCKMVASGNPNAVESLFCHRMIHVSGEWEELRLIRHRFLTQQLVHNYIEYAKGQLKRYRNGQSVHTTGGKPGEKWLYHIIRLAKDAQRVAQGKEPEIWKEGEDRDFILRIRRQEIPDDKIIQMSEGMFQAVLDMAPYPLPAESDRDALQRWMMKVRGLNEDR